MTEKYLSHAELEGVFVSSPPPPLFTQPSPRLPFHPSLLQTQMDPINNANNYPYLTTEWLNAYPSMDQLPATEAKDQAYDTSIGGWDVWEPLKPMAGPSTSRWNAIDYGEHH